MTTKWIAVLLAALGFATSSSAAPITWEFEGVVRYSEMGASSALASSLGVTVGAPMSGKLTYESTTPNVGSLSGFGIYSGAVVDFDVEIGSYAAEFAYSTVATMYVSLHHSGPYDLVFAQGSGVPDVMFPRGLTMTLGLRADSPGIISTSALPSTPPALSGLAPFSLDNSLLDWGTGLTFYGGDDRQIAVEFTRLEAVPEPATFALLAPLGPFALALAAVHRGRRP